MHDNWDVCLVAAQACARVLFEVCVSISVFCQLIVLPWKSCWMWGHAGLVIKPGTERNEMERNEMEKIVKSVDSGVV